MFPPPWRVPPESSVNIYMMTIYPLVAIAYGYLKHASASSKISQDVHSFLGTT